MYGKGLRLVCDLAGLLRQAAQHALQGTERLAARDVGDHSDTSLFEPVSMERTAASSDGCERIHGLELPSARSSRQVNQHVSR